MTVDQALQLAAALTESARKAMQTGAQTVDLTSELQAADDTARVDLEAAIEVLKTRIGESN